LLGGGTRRNCFAFAVKVGVAGGNECVTTLLIAPVAVS